MTRIIAGRVPLHPEAFSHDLGLRRKRPRIESGVHLKFIRGLPCLICGSRYSTQAAHIRVGNPLYGKRATGLSEKPADHWTLPLCAAHHQEQHRGAEMMFWARQGIDPFRVALALFACGGDEDAGDLIVKQARPER